MTDITLRLLAALALTLIWAIGSVCAEIPSLEEYQVKAAFIYNFAKFTEWPPGSFTGGSQPITLCILGSDPFGPALDAIAGKTVQSRELLIRRIANGTDLSGCRMAFVSESEQRRLSPILASLESQHVLSIGDMEAFAEQGGIIGLTKADGKVRFAINVDAAQRAGLTISSKLLKLASIVHDTR